MSTQSLGSWGESFAARYLSARGLTVVDRHYQKKWGELDLVCREGDVYVFVEVKTRSRNYLPSAVEAVHFRKRQRLIRAALSYMKWKRLEDYEMRFDLVLIEGEEVEWIRDAFPSTQYTY